MFLKRHIEENSFFIKEEGFKLKCVSGLSYTKRANIH